MDSSTSGSHEKATIQYLKNINLKKIDGSDDGGSFKASELWKDGGAVIMVVRRPGCILCREEAAELTKLKQKFNDKNFSLFAVVHELMGVEEFRNFFDGEVFLDPERKFYGPKERWMSLAGLLRPSVWLSLIRAKRKHVSGNTEGEGRLLGGLFVIGPGDKGILLEHRESEFGNHVDRELLLNVINE
ncbi:hypothetical protein HELRODRAFT_73106 [Helobdella robusta]|uniref:Peroxiredoxin-like 2A n=1 Tax=Helobdella robusta TaxID=6412 RepID=T1G1A3_HELRO|nr:hypothetical protein HELRODRAFT_73106 [Helobdella robusta]ESO09853.1 hypothetical protein HELRODRAFT_73106 [Helobdella robusta]